MDKLKLQQKWEDMAVIAYQAARMYPKSERHTLAADTTKSVIELGTGIARANRQDQIEYHIVYRTRIALQRSAINRGDAGQNKYQEEQAMKEQEARAERSTRLAASDWTQAADAPLTENEKARWREYRQALRDIPEQEGFPDTVVWPEEPSRDEEIIPENEDIDI